MASPGTGSTNQSLTFAASKRVYGKAHTSNKREIYDESIPSNVQLKTGFIFGEAIPESPIASSKTDDDTFQNSELYNRFSASAGGSETVEFVEFYIQSINFTDYDANDGSFGDVGFGGGDEATTSGFHGYQLVLTSSYETLSSGSYTGSAPFVNNQVVHQSNGALQLVGPLFGSQTANQYELELYTANPSNSGLKIAKTSPAEILVDYFNGTLFIQDFIASEIPTYARGFIYVGKFADEVITEASSSGGGVSYGRTAVTTTVTASTSAKILGVSASAALDIRLPAASGYTAGQYFTVKDEGGNSNTHNITIKTTGADKIDGETFIVLESPYAAVNLYSDGSSKFFIY
jgi:hypothetical protein